MSARRQARSQGKGHRGEKDQLPSWDGAHLEVSAKVSGPGLLRQSPAQNHPGLCENADYDSAVLGGA